MNDLLLVGNDIHENLENIAILCNGKLNECR